MKEDIEQYIRTCEVPKYQVLHKKFGLYMPLPIPLGPFNNVSMDFMTCLLEWEGIDAIFMVVNKLSILVRFLST